jgi:uncharacterized protein YqgQ
MPLFLRLDKNSFGTYRFAAERLNTYYEHFILQIHTFIKARIVIAKQARYKKAR